MTSVCVLSLVHVVLALILFILIACYKLIEFCVICLLVSYNVHSFVIFHVDVACNTNASDACEINFTYLLK